MALTVYSFPQSFISCNTRLVISMSNKAGEKSPDLLQKRSILHLQQSPQGKSMRGHPTKGTNLISERILLHVQP